MKFRSIFGLGRRTAVTPAEVTPVVAAAPVRRVGLADGTRVTLQDNVYGVHTQGVLVGVGIDGWYGLHTLLVDGRRFRSVGVLVHGWV